MTEVDCMSAFCWFAEIHKVLTSVGHLLSSTDFYKNKTSLCSFQCDYKFFCISLQVIFDFISAFRKNKTSEA